MTIEYVKLEGFKELDAGLKLLGKHMTARNVARRAMRKAGEPVAAVANVTAPKGVRSGDINLRGSYHVSPRLSKSQRRGYRKRSKVEMHIGSNNVAASKQEFGTRYHAPQPHFRSAWRSNRGIVLKAMKIELRAELMKAAKRIAKKRQRSRNRSALGRLGMYR